MEHIVTNHTTERGEIKNNLYPVSGAEAAKYSQTLLELTNIQSTVSWI